MTRRVLRGFDRSALIAVRTRQNLNPGELARIADVSTAAIYNWERGTASPSVDTLARVAEALAVPIAELVPIPEGERYLGDLRVLAGLTQPQLAQLAGISTSSLAQLERGQARLKPDVAARIADALTNHRTQSRTNGGEQVTAEQVLAAHERVRTRPPHTRP
ncbi:transcriptional regulator [Rhodococcus pyridinivorans]|uniref:helix-turn-helix transcriptional regulator n=1 Tax=Rhodococcus pyridinivorans TaxID=103816 RepID=UPI00222785FF|nr:helix-turn-helix transcriptional regulator [Rhodococcus pyridinivorans]MCW3472657.1 transcriptional regulator [Rhodococcus pyridinivorans]